MAACAHVALAVLLTLGCIPTCAAQINAWQTDTAPHGMQSIRAFHVAATLDADMLVYGGRNVAEGTLNDTWLYNYETDAWTVPDSAQQPPSRFAAAFTTYSASKLFLFGGLFNNDDELEEVATTSSSPSSYNPTLTQGLRH